MRSLLSDKWGPTINQMQIENTKPVLNERKQVDKKNESKI